MRHTNFGVAALFVPSIRSSPHSPEKCHKISSNWICLDIRIKEAEDSFFLFQNIALTASRNSGKMWCTSFQVFIYLIFSPPSLPPCKWAQGRLQSHTNTDWASVSLSK